MTKHTPGPWECTAGGFAIHRMTQQGTVEIARTNDSIFDGPGEEETRANARLIAAAPDLLAACEFALAVAEDRVEGNWDQVMMVMRQVIANATTELGDD